MRRRTVREIMTAGALCQTKPGASVRAAVRGMAERNVGSILVTDNGRLLGIFTERDAVRRVLAPGCDPDHVIIAEVMTREPDTIGPDDSVGDAIRRMDEFGYRHLPVVEGEAVVGMVSLRDCPIADLAAMRVELEDRHALAERAW